jgi:hypothetical protein
MSFVNYKDAAVVPIVKEKKLNSTVSMRLDVVPIPLGTLTTVSSEKRNDQYKAIQAIKKKGKDLFFENNTVSSVAKEPSHRLYQTADLYGEVLSVEKLVEDLKQHDLTLRVNAIRSGSHSQTTCMELTSADLQKVLTEDADNKKEKSVTLSLKATDGGSMYVGVKVARSGLHYITKVDYSVPTAVDTKLHIS